MVVMIKKNNNNITNNNSIDNNGEYINISTDLKTGINQK